MKFEDYLEQFCSKGLFMLRSYRIKPPLRIRLKQWFLERRGYIVRIELDWHYHSINPSKSSKGEGYGFARIYKYRPKHKKSSIDIVEGWLD